MENSLNNNVSKASLPFCKEKQYTNNSKSPLWLLLFIFFYTGNVAAQQIFNKVYTLTGKNTIFYDVAPLGIDGSFITIAGLNTDSGTYQIRMVRGNKDGIITNEKIVQHPDYPTVKLDFRTFNGFTKIHDNLFALLATKSIGSRQWGSSLLTMDSNGTILHKQDILKPVPAASDTFSFLTTVRYDGLGHLIVAGQNGSELPVNFQLLMKYDTSLNLVWDKMYHPSGGVLNTVGAFDLAITNNNYLLFGGGNDSYLSWYDTTYKIQSLIVATDTAGNEQWHYASPVKWMYDCEAIVFCGIATADGGYLYLTTGNVYDFYPTAPATAAMGKQKLIKLDASRNRLWEKEIEKFNNSFGSRPDKMIELEDKSVVLIHQYNTDSLNDDGQYFRDFLFSRYRADGSLMFERRLTPPKDVGDTSRIFSSWTALDICRMPDNGFLLGGTYINETFGSPTYGSQKGWLIRLDSNGCLGPGDPECWPVSIPSAQSSKSSFSIYPNPGKYYFAIDYRSKEPASTIIYVYDVVGKLMLQQPISIGKGSINATEWTAGVYLYKVVSSGKTIYYGKLVKQ